MLVSALWAEAAEEGLDLRGLFRLFRSPADEGTDDTLDPADIVSQLSFCLTRDGLQCFAQCQSHINYFILSLKDLESFCRYRSML